MTEFDKATPETKERISKAAEAYNKALRSLTVELAGYKVPGMEIKEKSFNRVIKSLHKATDAAAEYILLVKPFHGNKQETVDLVLEIRAQLKGARTEHDDGTVTVTSLESVADDILLFQDESGNLQLDDKGNQVKTEIGSLNLHRYSEARLQLLLTLGELNNRSPHKPTSDLTPDEREALELGYFAARQSDAAQALPLISQNLDTLVDTNEYLAAALKVPEVADLSYLEFDNTEFDTLKRFTPDSSGLTDGKGNPFSWLKPQDQTLVRDLYLKVSSYKDGERINTSAILTPEEKERLERLQEAIDKNSLFSVSRRKTINDTIDYIDKNSGPTPIDQEPAYKGWLRHVNENIKAYIVGTAGLLGAVSLGAYLGLFEPRAGRAEEITPEEEAELKRLYLELTEMKERQHRSGIQYADQQFQDEFERAQVKYLDEQIEKVNTYRGWDVAGTAAAATTAAPPDKVELLDKPISEYTILDCVTYLRSTKQSSVSMASSDAGQKINIRLNSLLSAEAKTNPPMFAYWRSVVALYDIEYAAASPDDGADFSIDQGKFFVEGSEITTKGADRRLFFEGIVFNPVYGKHVRKLFSIIIETLSYNQNIINDPSGVDDEGSIAEHNKNDPKKAAILGPSNKGIFDAAIKEKFEKYLEEEGVTLTEDQDGDAKHLPSHIMDTAINYARVFDFRHTTFLEFTKRGTTRSFGGEDLSWYNHPFAVVSYYLQRYKIEDAKALLLLISRIPASWIEASTGNEGQNRSQRIQNRKEGIAVNEKDMLKLRDKLIKYLACFYDVNKLVKYLDELEIPEEGSIFPTIGEYMYPFFNIDEEDFNSLNQEDFDKLSEKEQEKLIKRFDRFGDKIVSKDKSGKLKIFSQTDRTNELTKYKVALMGWKDVVDLALGAVPTEQSDPNKILSEIDKFNRAIGKSKLVKGPHMEAVKYFALLFYARQFLSYDPKAGDGVKGMIENVFYHDRHFDALREKILAKIAESGGAEGLPDDLRRFLRDIIKQKRKNRSFLEKARDILPSRKRAYLRALHGINGLGTEVLDLEFKPPVDFDKLETSTKEKK